MTQDPGAKSNKHKNDERTVKCPVDGCDEEPLARGAHLHVMRSSGDGHGEQGDVPAEIDLENLETVGSRQVEMDYPEERDAEQVARLCPYCERPFRGKHGVMIHLGQTAGRKNHPENPRDIHDIDDFSIVHVDDNENVVEVVEEGTTMPSTEQRRQRDGSLDVNQVQDYIDSLREQGLDGEADRAEQMLLGGD